MPKKRNVSHKTLRALNCRRRQAVWSSGSGGKAERDADVSALALEETVRLPVEQWPHSLVVTVTGLRKDVLAAELLETVCVRTACLGGSSEQKML